MSERNVFVPPEHVSSEQRVIFLAGPIQGAPDWQSNAISILTTLKPNICIASPRREKFEGVNYDEQVDWETENLRKAGKNGVIMFWLAKEGEQIQGRSYAQTTRAELFEWKVRHERDGAKIVIGIEEGFSGAKYIRRRFGQDCPNVPILNSLEETCKKVLEMIEY
jgi:hypothetical protein